MSLLLTKEFLNNPINAFRFFLFLINPRLRLFKTKNLKHLDDALDVLLGLLVFLLHQPG